MQSVTSALLVACVGVGSFGFIVILMLRSKKQMLELARVKENHTIFGRCKGKYCSVLVLVMNPVVAIEALYQVGSNCIRCSDGRLN